MAKCILFVEGGSNTENGDLRRGFEKLLGQEPRLRGRMPKIEISDNTDRAVKRFSAEIANPHSIYDCILLLVDLDGQEVLKEEWLSNYGLSNVHQQVFFMIQEMEAWFLSQPNVLHDFYHPPLPHALPKATPNLVAHPAQELARCTKNHKPKGTYHKTAHGARLLAALHLPKLKADFPDVDRLVGVLC